MAVSLRPMSGPEISEYLVASCEAYVAERVVAGDDAAAAAREADEQIAAMFPNGEPAPGHLLFLVEDDGLVVGSLWLGPAPGDRPGSLWVWDVVIDAASRGRGLGKATMLLAEREARSSGATELGLNVFGHNTIARSLYDGLGYRAVATRMSKQL